MKPLYAEDVNYWKSSQSQPDTWIDRAKKEIAAIKGRVTGEAFGAFEGKAAFVLTFEIDGDQYKAQWPVLQSKTGNERAAKVQAATLLYHDVKHRCVLAKVFGARVAFVNFLLLSDGHTVAEAANSEAFSTMPLLLTAPKAVEGEIVD